MSPSRPSVHPLPVSSATATIVRKELGRSSPCPTPFHYSNRRPAILTLPDFFGHEAHSCQGYNVVSSIGPWRWAGYAAATWSGMKRRSGKSECLGTLENDRPRLADVCSRPIPAVRQADATDPERSVTRLRSHYRKRTVTRRRFEAMQGSAVYHSSFSDKNLQLTGERSP
jgi:hypothetical protein